MNIDKTDEHALIDAISNDNIEGIEDFLGYPISADILENLELDIKSVLSQMPDDEINKYMRKYNIYHDESKSISRPSKYDEYIQNRIKT